MSWSNPGPVPSQKFLYAAASSGTTVSVTIPAGDANSALEVIDNIIMTGTSNASGNGQITVNGNVIAQMTITLNQNFVLQLDFSAGWPQWNASGSDAVPVGSNVITLTLPSAIVNASLLVNFHYLNPAVLRN